MVAVTPDPRTTSVDSVIFNFSKAVTGVELGDFSLFLDGVALDLTGASLTAVSATQYRLNLTAFTGANGSYTLTLNASGSEIRDAAGNLFATSVTDRWVKIASSAAAPRPVRLAKATTNPSVDAPTKLALSQSTVAENSAGATIGNLVVTDPKKSATHVFIVSDTRFEVVGSTLKLKKEIALDFDAAATISLNITAIDQADPSRRLTTRVTIAVTEVREWKTGNSFAGSPSSSNDLTTMSEAEQFSLLDSLFIDFSSGKN